MLLFCVFKSFKKKKEIQVFNSFAAVRMTFLVRGVFKIHILLVIFSSVDHSRIHLQLGLNDYINASLITVEEAQRKYILTQVSTVTGQSVQQ